MEDAIERQVGLDDSRYNADYRKLEGIRNLNDPKKAIDAMLRDKRVAQQAEFEVKGKKQQESLPVMLLKITPVILLF